MSKSVVPNAVSSAVPDAVGAHGRGTKQRSDQTGTASSSFGDLVSGDARESSNGNLDAVEIQALSRREPGILGSQPVFADNTEAITGEEVPTPRPERRLDGLEEQLNQLLTSEYDEIEVAISAAEEVVSNSTDETLKAASVAVAEAKIARPADAVATKIVALERAKPTDVPTTGQTVADDGGAIEEIRARHTGIVSVDDGDVGVGSRASSPVRAVKAEIEPAMASRPVAVGSLPSGAEAEKTAGPVTVSVTKTEVHFAPVEGVRSRDLAKRSGAELFAPRTSAATDSRRASTRQDLAVGRVVAEDTPVKETKLVPRAAEHSKLVERGAQDNSGTVRGEEVSSVRELRSEMSVSQPPVRSSPVNQIVNRLAVDAPPSAVRDLKASAPKLFTPTVLKVINIELQPANLGSIAAQISVAGDELRLVFTVSTAQTAQALSLGEEKLAQQLRVAGYEFDGLAIQVSATERGSALPASGYPVPTESTSASVQARPDSGSSDLLQNQSSDRDQRSERRSSTSASEARLLEDDAGSPDDVRPGDTSVYI